MRPTHLIELALFTTLTVAQGSDSILEPNNFDVTQALQRIGVPVSKLPVSNPYVAAVSDQPIRTSCALACESLSIVFDSNQVLVQGEPEYNSFTATYWSGQQGAVNPFCVFKPAKSLDVSKLILLARLYQCPFSVKSGGHAAWANASSIEDGITISMEKFKQAVVSADKSTVDIGPGLTWVEAYTAVEKYSLSIVGGRMAPVGVSGLILGGGISHFANRRGWACDNVESYELVTATGIPINVTQKDFPEIYWALRGGGNNFGVVTNFKLSTFQQGQMWGGQRMYLEDSFPRVLDAIYEFAVTESRKDQDAAEFVTIAPYPGIGKIMFANLHYAKPVSNAPVFNDWNEIAAVNGSDTTGLRNMSGMANLLNEGAPAPGAFQTFWGVTFKMDRGLLDIVVENFFMQVATIADVPQILQVMAIQPITEGALRAMRKNGGNALGLDPDKGPYFVLNFNSAWVKEEDEAKFHNVIYNVIDAVKMEAKKKHLDNDFIYMNYASEYQDPVGSYGHANKQRLIRISKKYDPRQVFQYLQPGGFKLGKNAPNAGPP